MGHLRSFGLNNFRVFNTETDFELRAITILTGTNSSGKSSFIKGLQVMKLAFSAKKPFLDSLNEINLNEVKNLGGFDLLKNRDNDSPTISFKLPFILPNQFNQMTLKLDYKSNNSILKNAELESLIIMDKEEKVILYHIYFDERVGEWKMKINFSELYQYLRDFKEVESEFESIAEGLYNKREPYAEKIKSLKYEEVLKQLKVLSPELTRYKTLDHDCVYSFEEKSLRNSYSKLPFDKEFFLFPFLFLHCSKSIDQYIKKNLHETEQNTLYHLRERIDAMREDEKKLFFMELVEAEKKLLQLMKPNFVSYGGRSPEFDVFHDLTFSADNILSSGCSIGIEFCKLAGKSLASLQYWEKNPREKILEEWFPLNEYPIDLVKDSHEFFIKNNINRNFLMLSTSHPKEIETNIYSFFNKFCTIGFEEALDHTKSNLQDMEFVPSIRSQSGRVFHNDESSYLNKVIQEFYEKKCNQYVKPNRFLNKYIAEFKIADKVDISYNGDALTSTIHFVKNGQRINIADLGYGISQLLPILIRIAINITINDSGYGMTDEQIHDFDIKEGTGASILLIEEPETNLHPALQSKLADLFVECYQKYNIQFIIETHSEYFIRKLQYKIAKQEFSHKDANIYYFNDPESEAYKSEVVYKIDIEKNGILSRPFGAGFFDESNNLNMSLYLLTKDSLN